MVQLDGNGVVAQPLARRAPPRIALDDAASGWRIDAADWRAFEPSTSDERRATSGEQGLGVADCLDPWQHDALVRLLQTPTAEWTSHRVVPKGDGSGCALEYTVAEPRLRRAAATADTRRAPSQIGLRLHIQGETGKRQQVVGIDLMDEEGHTTVLPAGRLDFRNTPGLPCSAHVPMAVRDHDAGLLERSEGKIAFARQDDGTLLARYRVDAASRTEVELRLSPDRILGGWRVSLVHEQPCAQGRLVFDPQCRTWLEEGDESPRLPRALVTILSDSLEQYARGEALGPAGAKIVDPLAPDPHTPVYPCVTFDGEVPLSPPASGSEPWSVTVYLIAHGDGWRIPEVQFKGPGMPLGGAAAHQPDRGAWCNPFRTGLLSSLLAPQGPANVDAVRGWPLTIAASYATLAWDALGAAYGRLDLEGRSSDFKALSGSRKILSIVNACQTHQGEAVLDARQPAPVIRFKRVSVAGREVDVCVRLRDRYLDRRLRVMGVKVVEADQAVEWKSTLQLFRLTGRQADLAAHGGRAEALRSRGIYARWEAAGNSSPTAIFSDIATACAVARDAGEELRPHDRDLHIFSMEVPYFGASERFYLRFSDHWCDEVLDIRVRGKTFVDGAWTEDTEDAVVNLMRASAAMRAVQTIL